MVDNRFELLCSLCPNGCLLNVTVIENAIIVSGGSCPKGESFAMDEIKEPKRILTTTLKTTRKDQALISVKSDAPVNQSEMIRLVSDLSKYAVELPVYMGQIIFEDIGENHVNIISTSNLLV